MQTRQGKREAFCREEPPRLLSLARLTVLSQLDQRQVAAAAEPALFRATNVLARFPEIAYAHPTNPAGVLLYRWQEVERAPSPQQVM